LRGTAPKIRRTRPSTLKGRRKKGNIAKPGGGEGATQERTRGNRVAKKWAAGKRVTAARWKTLADPEDVQKVAPLHTEEANNGQWFI